MTEDSELTEDDVKWKKDDEIWKNCAFEKIFCNKFHIERKIRNQI